MTSTSNDPTFLDVEDDEQRQKRIGTLLERLNTASSASSNPVLDIGRERAAPGPVEPSAELLARVQAFLPAISASNEALSRQRPEDVDIENVAGHEERYIEMNLGLGVFEAKSRSARGSRSPSSATTSGSESASDSDSSMSTSEADSESDSDSESAWSSEDSDAESQSGSSVDMKPISSRPIKPLPRRVSQQATLPV